MIAIFGLHVHGRLRYEIQIVALVFSSIEVMTSFTTGDFSDPIFRYLLWTMSSQQATVPITPEDVAHSRLRNIEPWVEERHLFDRREHR